MSDGRWGEQSGERAGGPRFARHTCLQLHRAVTLLLEQVYALDLAEFILLSRQKRSQCAALAEAAIVTGSPL